MDSRKSKYLGLAGLGVIAAATVAYFSTMWPPASFRNTQGAVGKREVYRDPQLTDKDVGVAGKGSVTVDDLKKIVQSQAFRQVAGNAKFSSAVADGAFGAFMNSQNLVQTLADPNFAQVVQNSNFQSAVQNANFTAMLADKNFAAALNGGSVQINQVMQQYQLGNAANVSALVNNASFQTLVHHMEAHGGVAQHVSLLTNNNISALVQIEGFATLLQMPGFIQMCGMEPVQNLAGQGQLSQLATNAALQNATMGAASF